jgi:hypothetical protein
MKKYEKNYTVLSGMGPPRRKYTPRRIRPRTAER